jgi:hypothetical protein
MLVIIPTTMTATLRFHPHFLPIHRPAPATSKIKPFDGEQVAQRIGYDAERHVLALKETRPSIPKSRWTNPPISAKIPSSISTTAAMAIPRLTNEIRRGLFLFNRVRRQSIAIEWEPCILCIPSALRCSRRQGASVSFHPKTHSYSWRLL